ncbi:hypothetical protein A9Z06_07180 [Rhizobium sp. YK2]|nr:hypothetical protein A9Z06_07180 [Rhizobium sp. YK2]
MSKQTISDVVRNLENNGWLKPTGYTDGRLGRTAITYELDASAGFAASIDLGGTKIVAVPLWLARRWCGAIPEMAGRATQKLRIFFRLWWLASRPLLR